MSTALALRRFALVFALLFASTWAVQYLAWGAFGLVPAYFPALWYLDAPGFWPLLLRPWGMIFVAFFCLSLEWYAVGWKNSSLRHLFRFSDASVRTDWFCFVGLSLFGLRTVMGSVFSMGLTLWIQHWAGARLSWHWMSDRPLALQIAFLFVLNPFLFYVIHRTMHWGFWEIHRVHHSATSMTILTPHRNHPVDWVVVTLINTVPAALCGCSFWAIGLYELINGVYQSLVHSNMGWHNDFVNRYLLISPEAHRLHHSNNPEHFDKNFGILVFWDWAFGTHLPPKADAMSVEIGFTDGELHNSGKPVREIFHVLVHWLKSLRGPKA